MEKTEDRALSPDERRVAIEAKVARYPELDPSELKDVLRWFRKEATAYDAAMLASNEAIAASYQRLRTDHLDRLTPSEKFAVWLVGALVVVGIAAVALAL